MSPRRHGALFFNSFSHEVPVRGCYGWCYGWCVLLVKLYASKDKWWLSFQELGKWQANDSSPPIQGAHQHLTILVVQSLAVNSAQVAVWWIRWCR